MANITISNVVKAGGNSDESKLKRKHELVKAQQTSSAKKYHQQSNIIIHRVATSGWIFKIEEHFNVWSKASFAVIVLKQQQQKHYTKYPPFVHTIIRRMEFAMKCFLHVLNDRIFYFFPARIYLSQHMLLGASCPMCCQNGELLSRQLSEKKKLMHLKWTISLHSNFTTVSISPLQIHSTIRKYMRSTTFSHRIYE